MCSLMPKKRRNHIIVVGKKKISGSNFISNQGQSCKNLSRNSNTIKKRQTKRSISVFVYHFFFQVSSFNIIKKNIKIEKEDRNPSSARETKWKLYSFFFFVLSCKNKNKNKREEREATCVFWFLRMRELSCVVTL